MSVSQNLSWFLTWKVTLLYHVLSHWQTVLQSGYTILHSHQWWVRVPISPHPHKNVHIVCFDYSSPTGCEVVSTVVLIYISLMTNDAKNFSMYLLSIYIYSLEKYLFKSFAHLYSEVFIFLLLNCKNSLYSLDKGLLWETWF